MKPNICVRIVRLQLYQINVAGIRRSADLHSPYDTLYDTLMIPYTDQAWYPSEAIPEAMDIVRQCPSFRRIFTFLLRLLSLNR